MGDMSTPILGTTRGRYRASSAQSSQNAAALSGAIAELQAGRGVRHVPNAETVPLGKESLPSGSTPLR
jgi:hypothetical protein